MFDKQKFYQQIINKKCPTKNTRQINVRQKYSTNECLIKKFSTKKYNDKKRQSTFDKVLNPKPFPYSEMTQEIIFNFYFQTPYNYNYSI